MSLTDSKKVLHRFINIPCLLVPCKLGQIKQLKIQNSSYLVLIGPEGDFSPNEITDAKNAGFNALSLGNTRLRTETAGLYAVQAFSILT